MLRHFPWVQPARSTTGLSQHQIFHCPPFYASPLTLSKCQETLSFYLGEQTAKSRWPALPSHSSSEFVLECRHYARSCAFHHSQTRNRTNLQSDLLLHEYWLQLRQSNTSTIVLQTHSLRYGKESADEWLARPVSLMLTWWMSWCSVLLYYPPVQCTCFWLWVSSW